MSDAELIARLRDGCNLQQRDGERAADLIEALTAKLATCEKYRDAYAEMGRIGTQAVRDLEAKLAKAVEALGVLIQHTHNCEKELTEDLHHADFCGESGPLTDARATLAEIKSGIATTPYGLEGESHE
jgi:hypothetical protein